MTEIIKHINNGREVSGRMKINFIVKYPNELGFGMEEPPASINGIFSPGSERGVSRDSMDGIGGVGGVGGVGGASRESFDMNDIASSPGLGMIQMQMQHNLTDKALTPAKLKPPFNILVQELTVLDTGKDHTI